MDAAAGCFFVHRMNNILKLINKKLMMMTKTTHTRKKDDKKL